jgi:hypothetical protein
MVERNICGTTNTKSHRFTRKRWPDCTIPNIDEVTWRLKQRAGRAIVCLIAFLYLASGRILDEFEDWREYAGTI